MKTIIKIEECAMLIIAFILSMRLGFDWWLFVVLLFLPDISIAGYMFGNTAGTAIYNLFHFKAVAVAIALAGLYLENNVVVLAALALFGHSSLDRIFGFGLKFPDDFNHTHMGMIGKDKNPISIMEANAQNSIKRTELSNINTGKREVSSIKIVEIEFQAGQKAPIHQHPCPVIGQIVSGTCLVQIKGENPKILKPGDTFYEPAEIPVIHFDNYSETEPMKFVAYYLTNGERDLIEILKMEHK